MKRVVLCYYVFVAFRISNRFLFIHHIVIVVQSHGGAEYLNNKAKKLLKHPHGFLVMLSNVIVTPNTCWKHDRHYKLLWKWCGQADKIILSDNYPVLRTLTKIFSASFFDIQ